MSDNDPADRAYIFLQDAMFKRAWGESWDVCDPSDLLDYLIPAVGEALQAIEDPNDAARILLGTHDQQGPEGPEAMSLLLRAALSHASRPGRAACTRAVEQGGAAVVELLVEEFADDAENEPVAGLIAGMKVVREPDDPDRPAPKVLMRALGEVVSAEGVRFLWEYYEEYLGWDGGLDEAAVLVKMYERAVCAVTDVKWLADQVLEACESVASADNDISAWLPDREQLSKACVDAIKAAGEPITTRDAMQRPFWLAIKDADEPRDVMADTFQNVTNRVDDHADWRIAEVVVRAYQRTMRDTFSAILTSVQEAVEDRERAAELVLEVAEVQRAFDDFLFPQPESSGEEDRQRAAASLTEALAERVASDPPCEDEPLEPPLLRASGLAAGILYGSTTRAHIMALIHRATGHVRSGVQMEHALRGLVEAIAVLEDPAAEVEVMYAAYISTLRDRHSPSSAVTALLKATKHAIEHAEDQAGVVKTLLNGLSVTPTGWPPPRPVWLMP